MEKRKEGRRRRRDAKGQVKNKATRRRVKGMSWLWLNGNVPRFLIIPLRSHMDPANRDLLLGPNKFDGGSDEAGVHALGPEVAEHDGMAREGM